MSSKKGSRQNNHQNDRKKPILSDDGSSRSRRIDRPRNRSAVIDESVRQFEEEYDG